MRTLLLISATLSSLFIINAHATSIDTPAAPLSTQITTPNIATHAVNAIPATAQTASTPAPQTTITPNLKANLTLKQEGQRLYAHVLLEQAQNSNGKIRIDWTPPSRSSCDKSTYFLPYQGKQFHTQAYRTLGYGLISGKSITCTGTWHASVINEQGKTLATATITIQSVDAYANNTAAKMHSLAVIA